MERSFTLRGYIKVRGDGRYVAVCLKPNLVVEGATKEEAFQKFEALLEAYMKDARRDGQLNEFMSRRAPLSFYLEYAQGRLQSALKTLHRPFITFTETCPQRQHA